jgi:hypothetical protein
VPEELAAFRCVELGKTETDYYPVTAPISKRPAKVGLTHLARVARKCVIEEKAHRVQGVCLPGPVFSDESINSLFKLKPGTEKIAEVADT